MPNKKKVSTLDSARQALLKGAKKSIKKRKAFLTRLQLPASKEVKKKLQVMRRYGIYTPKWDTATKGNWTTAREREIERRFNRFQGQAKITINHRPVYPFQRGEKGWKLTEPFRFRQSPVRANSDVRKLGITNTSKGAFVPRSLGRVHVDPKTGELYYSAKHGKARRGKRTYRLDVEQATRILHYVSSSKKARQRAEHAEGKRLYEEVFKGIDEGNTIFTVDFFGSENAIGSESDLKRFANQYATKLSKLPGATLGAFTVERVRVK